MVVPADRLFTREYLKSLFPNRHIEMARYSIFVLCFLSVTVVSIGAREERSCRQLNLFHLMCDDDDYWWWSTETCQSKEMCWWSCLVFWQISPQAVSRLPLFCTYQARTIYGLSWSLSQKTTQFGGLMLGLWCETASVNLLTSMRWTSISHSAMIVELARSSLVLTTSCPSICQRSTKI